MEGHYDKTNYINGEDKTTERSRKNLKHSERPVWNVGYRIVVDFGRDYCIGSYFQESIDRFGKYNF